MKTDRLRRVIEMIEDAPELFDQLSHGLGAGHPEDCGTPACVAGWARECALEEAGLELDL